MPNPFASETGAAIRYASPKAGSTRNACNILARKPNPTATPAKASQRGLAFSSARTTQYAPATSISTRSASGLLKRNISAATGVSASTAPARRPTAGPDVRRTVAYSSHTEPTPISACGTRTLHALTPNSRADSEITHTAAGVLSTVIAFAASLEPKNNAFQLCAPACAAAE